MPFKGKAIFRETPAPWSRKVPVKVKGSPEIEI